MRRSAIPSAGFLSAAVFAVLAAASFMVLASPAWSADGNLVVIGSQATGTSSHPAIWGVNSASGTGVWGWSNAQGTEYGVYGGSDTAFGGVGGYSGRSGGYGVHGVAPSGIGVYGNAAGGTGVWGDGSSRGVVGTASASSGAGVFGKADTAPFGTGVAGIGSYIGVEGRAHSGAEGWGTTGVSGHLMSGGNGNGVRGEISNIVLNSPEGPEGNFSPAPVAAGAVPSGNGVYGVANDQVYPAKPLNGVNGETASPGSGVRGANFGAGAGVTAIGTKGPALDVQGKARFSNAGKAMLRAGTSSTTVTGVQVGPNSGILVTLMGDAGVVVRYAVPLRRDSFRVVFTGPATKNAPFAYFIFN